MKATRIKRMAAVAALGAALLVSAPAAVAAGADTAAQDQPTIAFSAPGGGTRTVEVREGSAIMALPDVTKRPPPTGASDCPDFNVCMWTRSAWNGALYRFDGDYRPCEGWRFEGTELQDQVWSFWNRASGPVSVWDRFRDGSFRYQKLAPAFPRGANDGDVFSDAADAWVYDPRNDCRTLTLHPVFI